MKLMALDLEMNQPSNKIIQIGVAWGDLKTDRFPQKRNWIINCHEEVDPFIVTLTGLTQADITNGLSMQQAYNELCYLHKELMIYHTMLVWGTGDLRLLKQQSPVNDNPNSYNNWRFGSHALDVKSVYQTWKLAQGEPHLKGGLARAMTKFNLNFQGRKHRADDDAYNTWMIYRELVKCIPVK